MKVLVVLATLVTLALAHPHGSYKAPFHAADSTTAIDGEYIVVFKKDVGDDVVASHMTTLRAEMMNRTKVGKEMTVMYEYNLGKTFRGYAAAMAEDMLEEIRCMAEVAYVERNQIMKALQADCKLQLDATWGLVRTSLEDYDKAVDKDYSYSVEHEGEDVDAYIIDTGIEDTHPDFGGRIDVSQGKDYIDSGNGKDYHGHGTHVAGTVLGNTWGLAKKATGIAIRVLNANGSGTTAGVIAGVDHVGNAVASNGRKSVANMSLGGGFSQSMNDAVDGAVFKGVHMAVAAGNEFSSACIRSPASAPLVVTVGATDDGDYTASFSNYGPCMDLYAPGVAVTSAWLNGGTNTISGTSMASPHVAGVMVKILSSEGAMTPAVMKAKILDESKKGKISNVRSDTNNYMLFHDCV